MSGSIFSIQELKVNAQWPEACSEGCKFMFTM